jgi:hypothetical protein
VGAHDGVVVALATALILSGSGQGLERRPRAEIGLDAHREAELLLHQVLRERRICRSVSAGVLALPALLLSLPATAQPLPDEIVIEAERADESGGQQW